VLGLLETPPDLRPWVQCIWTLESGESDEAAPIAPDGCCEWILHLGAPPLAWRDGVWHRQPRAGLFGQLQQPLRLRRDRATHCLAVRLRPHAAAPLFDVSGFALCPEELAIPDLTRCVAPLRWLGEIDSLEHAYRSVIAALRALAREARPFDPMVIAAAKALERDHGGERIAGLARRLGVSKRTLERRFFDGVGLPPKRFARIARMQQSLRLLSLPEASVAGVAHTMGYADQAHLTRELVELAGCRPGEIRRAG
jgi:AraC-like DNA-binding protein